MATSENRPPAPKVSNPAFHSTRNALQIVFGVGMGAGLTFAGMTHADAAWNFFDLKKLLFNYSKWNPDLIIVFPVALAVHAAIFWRVIMQRKAPVYDDHFHFPTNPVIDKELLAGSALFGIGWAIGGLCPGPGVISVLSGDLNAISYVASLFAGFTLTNLYCSRKEAAESSWWEVLKKNETIQYTLGLGAIFAGFYYSKPLQYLPAPLITIPASPALRVLGASIIGGSAALMMLLNGQILGNSGILGGLVNPQVKHKWSRLWFWLGLGVGSVAVSQAFGLAAFTDISAYPIARFILGGLITGIGTTMANGCTSGHGICGISRLSPRSIAATATFFVTAIATSTLVN